MDGEAVLSTMIAHSVGRIHRLQKLFWSILRVIYGDNFFGACVQSTTQISGE